MNKFIRIGVDLGKNHCQVHALEGEGSAAVKRKLSRSKMRAFFTQSAPRRVGMEACGSAHYWARTDRDGTRRRIDASRLQALSQAGQKRCARRGGGLRSDGAPRDAARADQERRQQAVLMLHKTRELLVKERTMSVNAAHAAIWRSSALSSPRALAGSPSCSRWRTPTRPCRKRRKRP
jgi:transposase